MPQPASTLLGRRSHESRPSLPVLPEMSLTLARAHEFCGPARRTLAVFTAARMQGPVLWIRAGWIPDQLFCEGVLRWIDPGRLIWAHCRREEDILWSMEEALRSGAVPLVVAEVPNPPGLTPVRRLHLAAEAGAGMGKGAPLGVMLTPGDGGAAGIESRWHLAPRHTGNADGWHLSRRRARAAPPQTWHLSPASGSGGSSGLRLSPPVSGNPTEA